jgi:hypothetical protein
MKAQRRRGSSDQAKSTGLTLKRLRCKPECLPTIAHAIYTMISNNVTPSIISVQETNLDRNPGLLKITNNNAYKAVCAHKRNIETAPAAKGGVLSLIPSNQTVHCLERNEAYVITLTFLTDSTVHIHTTVYISPSLNDEELYLLYSNLSADLASAHKRNRRHNIMLTLAGDFNARLGNTQFTNVPALQRHSESKNSAHRTHLIRFCQQWNLYIASGLQTLTHTHTTNQGTEPGGELDYILASKNLLPHQQRTSTENTGGVLAHTNISACLSLVTDHHLVWASFHVPARTYQTDEPTRKKQRIAYETISQNETLTHAFTTHLTNSLLSQDTKHLTPTQQLTHIINSVKGAAHKAKVPYKRRYTNILPKQSASKLLKLRHKRDHAILVLRQAQRLKKPAMITKAIKKLKSISIQERDLKSSAALNCVAHAPNNSKTYSNLRNILFFNTEDTSDRSSISAVLSKSDDILFDVSDIKREIETHFNNTQDLSQSHAAFDAHYYSTIQNSVQQLFSSMPHDSQDILHLPITLEEVMRAMKRLPQRSQPGVDEIPYEALTAGGTTLAQALADLMTDIQNKMTLPDQWREGLIVLLHKKDSTLDLKN